MTADSVSIFAEGTFDEQIQELVNYIARNRSDEEKTAFIRPFQDALKPADPDDERRKKVFAMVLGEVKGLGEGSEKEIEGFFNLIYAHLFTIYPVDSPEVATRVNDLVQTISSAPSEQTQSKYRILSNLYNALPRASPLRLAVYKTLLQLAVSQDQLSALQLSQPDVEKWLQEWNVSSEQKSDFLKSIADAYEADGQLEVAYQYTLLYTRHLPSSVEPQKAALEGIATALRLTTLFDYDPLFKLDAVVATKSHPLFQLLQIFLNDGLAEYSTWEAQNTAVLDEFHIDKLQLTRKIRLLTLASLASPHIGKDLAYSEIAKAIQVDQSEVEKWVIDVIRTGLLSGKLSQTTSTLHVTRSTARSFNDIIQWEALEKRLLAWKSGLSGVLGVISDAAKRGGAHHVATAATQVQATSA